MGYDDSNTPITFSFFADPGHGWLEVPIGLLEELDIADKVSGYSYRAGMHAYLEEDCDYSLFLEAMKNTGRPFQVKHFHTDHDSTIRNYPRFS